MNQILSYLSPQRDALFHLKLLEANWLSNHNKRVFHESFDRTTRFVEDLDAVRERCQVMHEEIKHTLTDALNRNMYILSVFAAIFLPLSFVTGLFGVNLNGIPGAQSHMGFELFSISLLAITFALIVIFRKLKWM